jgi:hypothetical protein
MVGSHVPGSKGGSSDSESSGRSQCCRSSHHLDVSVVEVAKVDLVEGIMAVNGSYGHLEGEGEYVLLKF